jgi:hypothetical protein
MNRRRWLLVVGAVALLGVAGFHLLIWLTISTPGVSLENFRRLRHGMSERDAEALLGKAQDSSAENHRQLHLRPQRLAGGWHQALSPF